MPQEEPLKNESDTVIDEETEKMIDEFLTKKRKAILYALYGGKERPHKELADAAGTSPASLSNILLKFEQFPYKLLDSRTSGKYRYYFLTKLGRDYIERRYKDVGAGDSEPERVLSHEAARLLQEAKECLEKFREMHEDDWEMLLDDALISRIKYLEIQDSESEELVDKFLEDIERVLLGNGEACMDKVLKLLSDNAILQARLARFMDKFAPFAFVLEELDNGQDILQIYGFLEAAVKKDATAAKACSERLGWHDRAARMLAAIEEIAGAMKDRSAEEVYRCFCWYLAGDKALSAFLTKLVNGCFESKAQHQ